MTTLLLSLLVSTPTADAKATEVAEQVLEALGGRQAWEDARYIRFTFVRGGRSLDIAWDRYTGRYRLDATNDANVPYTVIMNLNTRQGSAWLEGRPLTDKELSEYLTRASRVWAGETYWLLMPYKLFDPGVHLTYEGEETLDGKAYDVLHLEFENVGFTPGDTFSVFVDPKTHLVDRWRFKLQSGYEGDFRWTDWETFDGIRLATKRVSAGEEPQTLLFKDIVVSHEAPDDVFTPPGPNAPPPVPR